jgi:hypothetical protein
MSDTLTYQQMGTAARGRAYALFAQTMGNAAATAFARLIGMQPGGAPVRAAHGRVARRVRPADRLPWRRRWRTTGTWTARAVETPADRSLHDSGRRLGGEIDG